MQAIRYGIDLAKSVFQVHGVDAEDGVDAEERVVMQRQLRRGQVLKVFAGLPPALIGMEACGSAHHWARELVKLGHDVRLMPADYVKAYVRRNKNDARDAEACCEAVSRPTMRTVPIKTVEQQCARAIHRARDLMVRQRTQLVCLVPLAERWRSLDAQICGLDGEIVAQVRQDPVARRLMTIPGVGPVTAHAVICAIGDGRQFATARDFAAWTGLTRKNWDTGGKNWDTGGKARLTGHISKAGDKSLRRLLVLGASAWLRHVRAKPDRAGQAWITGVLARRPVKVCVIAQAAKTARIIWAILRSGQPYRTDAVA